MVPQLVHVCVDRLIYTVMSHSHTPAPTHETVVRNGNSIL